MKKLCYLFSFLSLSISSSAQVNLDSLWSIWNDKNQADTVRLEAVYYFMQGGVNREFRIIPLFEQNPDSLLALTKLVEEVTEASGSKKYELMAVRQKGIYLQIIQNLQEAVKSYEQALEMAKAMQDKRLILMSTLTLAHGEKVWGMTPGSQDTARLAQAEKRYLEAINLLELESFDFDQLATKLDPQLSSYACVALNSLGTTSYTQGNYPSAVHYSEKALIIADELLVKLSKAEFMPGTLERSHVSLLAGEILGNLGSSYNEMGSHVKAIENFERMLSLLYEAKDNRENKDNIARILNNIAIIYKNNLDVDMALSYYGQALKIAQEIDSKYVIVANLINTGNIHKDRGDYKTALENMNRAIKINTEEKLYPSGYLAIELGAVYLEMKDYPNANEYFVRAIENFESIGANGYLITAMSYQCRMFREQGQLKQAISLGEKGLKMAEEVGMITIQIYFSSNLYKAYKALPRNNKALEYHESLIILEDSLDAGETGKKLQQMEFGKQMMADSLAQEEAALRVEMAHQTEVNQKDKTRNVLLGSGFLVLLMAGGLWNRLNFTRKSKATLQVEKDPSENLLLNILPAEVAEELKLNGTALARDFDMVSIIFTDFKGFTETSAKLTASELVSELNYCFKGFDLIMEKYNIEKIKTIGDAYMAAGGLLGKRDSAIRTVRAALEMQEFISKRKASQDALGLISFEMRSGIHTGPVVAGIVGVKKFQYDIWGDTVNTASRMESNAEVGRVNISEDTYEQIRNEDGFDFENRGKIEVKGKEMEMYYVS